VGDLLWETGSRRARPELGPPAGLGGGGGGEDSDGSEDVEEDGGGEAGDDPPEASPESAAVGFGVLTLDEDTPQSEPEPVPEPPEPVNMDDLLYDAFRQAWRTTAKRLEFPVLVSNFYAQHMQPNSAQPLDVKKSSYKKISKFLERMKKDGLVQVEELSKGVQSIMSVQLEHPEIRSYRVQAISRAEEAAPPAEPDKQTRSRVIERIEELYIVSGNVVDIFRSLKVAKGTALSAQQVRKLLTEYVKKHELQDQSDKGSVTLDKALTSLTARSEGFVSSLRWDELHQRCLQKMSPGHLVAFRGEEPAVKKGAVPCVEMNTATRSGNKKITTVINLPVFGIDPAEFAHRCQVGVAASTSVGEAPNRPPGTSQVLVQGNQVRFIAKLLQEDFHVPKKYIKGLEKAPKK